MNKFAVSLGPQVLLNDATSASPAGPFSRQHKLCRHANTGPQPAGAGTRGDTGALLTALCWRGQRRACLAGDQVCAERPARRCSAVRFSTTICPRLTLTVSLAASR
jgi:hypothetical protein